jgi:hypothetical protein
MKKALLTTALTTALLSSTVSFAETVAEPSVFAKDFVINVQKEPIIIIDPPIEVFDMNADMFEASLNEDPMNGVMIGDLVVETTAQSCNASITTENNFMLMGSVNSDGTTDSLGSYAVHYLPMSANGMMTGEEVTFNTNTTDSQIVSCYSASLTLTALEVNAEAPGGIYNDIIHVVVEPEA